MSAENPKRLVQRWRRRASPPAGWPPKIPFYRWTIPDDPQERRDLTDLIKAINAVRPGQSQTERLERVQKLLRAYRAQGRGGRKPVEDDPAQEEYVRDEVAKAERLKRANPRMTWAQVAANLFIPEKTLYTYRAWVRDHPE